MQEAGFIRLWLTLSGWLAVSRAFSFSYTAPKSCDALNVTWTGGTAPFYLLVTPPSGTPRNISIPDVAYSGGNGAFSTTLELAAGRNFILTMSDATGWGTGGSSDLLTVGASESQSQCNLTDPSTAFTFQVSSNLQQCGSYSIGGYSGAVQPVHLHGIIPIGSTFSVNPPNNSSFNWTVNMSSGTRFLLFLEDTKGNLSMSSPVETVAGSSNNSCINSNSPHSTLSSVTQEPTANPTVSSGPTSSPGSGNHANNAAIIGGSVGGAVAFIVLVMLFAWWLMRRRDPMAKYARKRQRKGMDGMRALDLAPSTPNLGTTSPSHLPPLEFEPQPFILAPGNSNNDVVPRSPTSPTHSLSNDLPVAVTSPPVGHTLHRPSQATNSSTKAAMAGTSSGRIAPPPRFVLHTDAGSVDNVNGNTVELPPTYNAAAGQDPSTIPPPPASPVDNAGHDNNSGEIPSQGSTLPQNQPQPQNRASTTHLNNGS